jgi:hypothetical protein
LGASRGEKAQCVPHTALQSEEGHEGRIGGRAGGGEGGREGGREGKAKERPNLPAEAGHFGQEAKGGGHGLMEAEGESEEVEEEVQETFEREGRSQGRKEVRRF